jgi:type VI secretion system protein ImpA
MASERILDIDELSAPISTDQPAGPNSRDDQECSNLHDDVDGKRRDARKNERKQETKFLFPEGSIERKKIQDPDWSAVVEAGKKLLLKSKDLWVATWLAEAVAREEGFAGLRDGLKLMHELCQRYWDHIHPRPDEIDGIRNTLAQIDSDDWAELVLLMPITKAGYSTTDYDKSTEMEGLDSDSDRDAYRSRGVISTVDFESRINDSGPEFLIELIENATEASQEYDALTKFFDERCGFDAPASSKVRENFEQSLTLIRELAEPHLPAEYFAQLSADDEHESQADSVPNDSTGNQVSEGGWNRQLAFKEIQKQAELFEKYEPNSPVASILRHAVRLGKLSWRELISGLVSKDESENKVLAQILKQTGFLEQSDAESSDD